MSFDSISKGHVWTGDIVRARVDSLERLDENSAAQLKPREAARRLSRGRPELGPFSARWVRQERRARNGS